MDAQRLIELTTDTWNDRDRDGRRASSHFYSDTLELLTQLGVGAGPTAG